MAVVLGSPAAGLGAAWWQLLGNQQGPCRMGPVWMLTEIQGPRHWRYPWGDLSAVWFREMLAPLFFKELLPRPSLTCTFSTGSL